MISEAARFLAEQEKARRDAILALVKPLNFARISESLAAALSTHTKECEKVSSLIRAQHELSFKGLSSYVASMEAARMDMLARYAEIFAPINEKESEPAELTPTPKKRIGFRFED